MTDPITTAQAREIALDPLALPVSLVMRALYDLASQLDAANDLDQNHRAEIDNLRAQIGALTKERDAADIELADMERDFNALRRDAQRCREERNAANAEISGLRALVGTIRDLMGCKARNVSDIDVEAHSKEIMARFYAVESERDAANAELAAMKAQLENVLDSHREGTWMARALDAERELAAPRAQAQQADELRDILSRILELSDDCTVRGLKAALRAKLQAGVSPPNAPVDRPSETRSASNGLLGGEPETEAKEKL